MSQRLSITESVDITPTPRILRTLGDIPFAAWQCLAELMDNSLDAFTEAENKGKTIETPRIDILWSNDFVPAKDREIVVEDNGLGMELEVLQKAAKAGYSSNDPIHNLGLFGMGFNIATARLGDETVFLSATPESSEWVGIKINFEQLIKDQTFSAPIVREPKKYSKESGTKIIVRNLKDGIFSEIRRKESTIRRQLETIYTPILSKNKALVFVQGKQLSPRLHCVWSDSRFIIRKGVRVEAIQRINRDLGETFFDNFRNRYLTEDEVIDLDISLSKGSVLPPNIVKRSRRLKGWIGIQRYAHPSDFGIDFIRNGRKILMGDKVLFGYENPDTGTFVSEYPVELGSTVGGRIVGELQVDYLIPTYQKNGFDTTDRAWRLTVEAIRGAGPILPKQRKLLGYDGDNESPLGKLVNAYRRTDPGTKNLAIPVSLAREYAKSFFAGEVEYESDEKWYKVAQEVDREKGEGGKKHTPVNIGDAPSDDIGSYLPDDPTTSGSETIDDIDSTIDSLSQDPTAVSPTTANSERDQLILASEKEESLSSKYSYNTSPGLEITAWRLRDGQIKVQGKRVPYHFFQDGIEVDFFYDQTHPILAEYPLSPKQLLLQGLAEKFSLRDPGISFQFAFMGLIENHLAEERINTQALQERAYSIVSDIRERLPSLLGHRFSKAKEVIQQVEAEEEELAKRLLDEAPNLLDAYQEPNEEAIQSLAYVSDATIKRLIGEFPEEFLDKKLFVLPYENLKIGTDAMRERLRKDSLDRVLSYFSDVVLLLQGGRAQSKQELLRYANTLSLLEGLLN
jgi:hypothetical protein